MNFDDRNYKENRNLDKSGLKRNNENLSSFR